MPDLSMKALVLRRADYSDYDRMVTLLTPDEGRLDAIARGCRRSKSPLMNATEAFTYGEYQLYRRGERYEIRQCTIEESHFGLRQDLDRLTHGAYWLRLIDAVASPGVEARNLLAFALRSLAYLNYSDVPPEILTLAFEVKLLALSGLSPRTASCAVCGREINSDARFDARQGGLCCDFCSPAASPISNGARRILMKLPRSPYENVHLLL